MVPARRARVAAEEATVARRRAVLSRILACAERASAATRSDASRFSASMNG